MPTLTPAQKTKYLAASSFCPSCRSPAIEGKSVTIESGTAWQEVSCCACDTEWIDHYTLTSVTEI